PQVTRDHFGLDPDRTLDEFTRVCSCGVDRTLRILLDQVADDRIGDEPGLDDLGQATDVVGPGKAPQVLQITEHPGRGVEGTHEVLALGGVDPGLSADRGVDHAKQCGGYQDRAYPAQPRGGHETGQVGGGTPAHTHHHVAAGE